MNSLLNFAGRYIFEEKRGTSKFSDVCELGVRKMWRSYAILTAFLYISMLSVAFGPMLIFFKTGVADVIELNVNELSLHLENDNMLKPKSHQLFRNITIQVQDYNRLVDGFPGERLLTMSIFFSSSDSSRSFRGYFIIVFSWDRMH